MNICLISQEYPPGRHVGGIATYTHNVAHALSRLGHFVHVITVGPGAPRIEMDEAVVIHRGPERDLRFRSLGYLLHSYRVAREISRLRDLFDIVQASEWSGEAFWYSLHPRVPLVSRLATPSYLVERLNSSSKSPTSRILNFMERVQVKNSAGIISSTSALARVVSDDWRIQLSRVKVIPNSMDLEWIRSFKSVMPTADFRGLNYLLYYGRLEERKGVHILARALPQVLQKHPELRVVFVGANHQYAGGSMRQYVLDQCAAFADRLVFSESLPQAELFPIVAQARLVVLPSLWEAFGFVCLETMCLGRPVILTSGSGFEEIVEDGVSGYLVPPGDDLALQEKILWCLEHDEHDMRVGRAAEDRASKFDVMNVASSLVSYYESLLQPTRAAVTASWITR